MVQGRKGVSVMKGLFKNLRGGLRMSGSRMEGCFSDDWAEGLFHD